MLLSQYDEGFRHNIKEASASKGKLSRSMVGVTEFWGLAALRRRVYSVEASDALKEP